MASHEDLRKRIDILLQFYDANSHFSESYIIEFFTSNHWEKIPKRWRDVLKDLTTTEISVFLLSETITYPEVWPLSLLAFKRCSLSLPIPRHTCKGNEQKVTELPCQEKRLKHIFRKHVKPKKQHEILLLSKEVKDIFNKSWCSHIVDFGSGQGHLARTLTLGHRCPVVTLEQSKKLLERASEFDEDALKSILKAYKEDGDIAKTPLTKHVEFIVPADISAHEFVNRIDEEVAKDIQGDSPPRYLLTSLHACGDLSATMIRLFNESPRIEALVSVSCCYMKLSTGTDSTCVGYPMSAYVASISNHMLPYKSRETSCHAIEDYRCRLLGSGPQLKMHCYRAALGTILRKLHPDMVRLPVQTIKKAFNLSFSEYVKLAFEKLKLPQPDLSDVVEAENLISQWVHVVIYFCICLMIAPTVESIILLDRMIYLGENGLQSELHCLFEPKLSPRCFAITSVKHKR